MEISLKIKTTQAFLGDVRDCVEGVGEDSVDLTLERAGGDATLIVSGLIDIEALGMGLIALSKLLPLEAELR